MVTVLEPGFVRQRAHDLGYSVAFGWLLQLWLHWLPPLIVSLDVKWHRGELSRRHNVVLNRGQGAFSGERLLNLGKVLVFFFLPALAVFGVWSLLFDPQSNYHLVRNKA